MDLPYPKRYPNLVAEMKKHNLTTYDLLKVTKESPEEALAIIENRKEPSALNLWKIRNAYFPNETLSYLFQSGAAIVNFSTAQSRLKHYVKKEVESHMKDVIA